MLWTLLITAASGSLWFYASTPGQAGDVPASWPANSTIPRSDNEFVLVLGVHPRCPCSHATVAELARVLAWCESPPAVYVLSLAPSGSGTAFEDTPLLRSLSAIEDVSIVFDRDGAEAAKFGITTSGHAVLFNGSGARVFSGGITAARGHEGDNAGSTALASLLTRKPTSVRITPIYGCQLVDQPGWSTDWILPSAQAQRD